MDNTILENVGELKTLKSESIFKLCGSIILLLCSIAAGIIINTQVHGMVILGFLDLLLIVWLIGEISCIFKYGKKIRITSKMILIIEVMDSIIKLYNDVDKMTNEEFQQKMLELVFR